MRGVFISHGLRLEMILVMERNFIYIAEALVIYLSPDIINQSLHYKLCQS